MNIKYCVNCGVELQKTPLTCFTIGMIAVQQIEDKDQERFERLVGKGYTKITCGSCKEFFSILEFD